MKKRRVPRRAVALTFDDGYADNLHNAKPLLERSGIPAAVFVVSGVSRQRREFWWDELERLLLQPGRLPAELELSIDGTTFHWQLGAAADCDEQASRRWRAWRALGTDDPTPRHGLYRALHRQLQPLSEEQRSSILHQLLLWAGAEPAVRPSHRRLTDQEVAALAKGGLVEIGAHMVTHSLLPVLPPSLQRLEIHESKQALENTIGRSVTLFSYPYGGLIRRRSISCGRPDSVVLAPIPLEPYAPRATCFSCPASTWRTGTERSLPGVSQTVSHSEVRRFRERQRAHRAGRGEGQAARPLLDPGHGNKSGAPAGGLSNDR